MPHRHRFLLLVILGATAWFITQTMNRNSVGAEALRQSPLPTPTSTATPTATPAPPQMPTPFDFGKQSQMDFQVDKAVAAVGDRLTYTLVLTTVHHPFNPLNIWGSVPDNTAWGDHLHSTDNMANYLSRDRAVYANGYLPTYTTFVTITYQTVITAMPPGGVVSNKAVFSFLDRVEPYFYYVDVLRFVQTRVITPTPTLVPPTATLPLPTATATPYTSSTRQTQPVSTPAPQPPSPTATRRPGWPVYLPETGSR